MADHQDDSFNASKAEVFEALGHPTRIRILKCLGERPLPFSELKRAAGLESNGLFAFHLGKLGGLVALNPEGAYALTDEGREALLIIEASGTSNPEHASSRPTLRLPRQKSVLAGLIIVLIVISSVAAYQQGQIAALNRDISSSTSTSVSTSTLTSPQTVVSITTVVSSTTVEKNVTTTVTSTAHIVGQPIPIASVETANITIGGPSGTIAVNPTAEKIYIPERSSLIVIDASSHSVIGNITLPASSNYGGIAIDYSRNVVYVSVEGGIAEINGSTDNVVGELPVNLNLSLAYNPSTHIIYGFSGTHRGFLTGADVRTGSVVANLSIGSWGSGVAVDQKTNMVYTVECDLEANNCNSMASIVNGTSETLVASVPTYSAISPLITINPTTGVVYISGGGQIRALNGTNGNVIFVSYPQTCLLSGMAVIPSSNQVLMIPSMHNYLGVYNGTSGSLMNMYSFPSSPTSVAYNPNTDELYVTLPGQFLSFHDFPIAGNVNSTLIGSGLGCAP